MKKKLPIIAIVCVLTIGVCIFLYPIVSALLVGMTQSSTILQYQRAVSDLSDSKLDQMKINARRYNESLYGSVLSDPFDSTEELDTSSMNLISIDELLGYIEIPKINVYLPIYIGTSEEVLKKGVGLLDNTSLPIGGENTHAVLAGHRGLPSATLLSDLDQVAEGDVFYINVLNEVLAYEIDQIKVVEPSETGDLVITEGKDYVTLVTCTPYGVNTQRLLVRGTRIKYTAETQQSPEKPNLVNEVVVIPTIFLMIAAFTIILLIRKKR